MAIELHRISKGFVDEEEVLLGIEVGDHHRHTVGVDAHILLTFTQRLFGAFVFGDVHVGADVPAIRHWVTPYL